MDYRETIKIEAKRGYSCNRANERQPNYVAQEADTIAIAQKFNRSAYDVATDIVAVRLSNDRQR